MALVAELESVSAANVALALKMNQMIEEKANPGGHGDGGDGNDGNDDGSGGGGGEWTDEDEVFGFPSDSDDDSELGSLPGEDAVLATVSVSTTEGGGVRGVTAPADGSGGGGSVGSTAREELDLATAVAASLREVDHETNTNSL